MTEDEVIEKLNFFKNAIINLKNENSDYKETIEELSAASVSEEIQKQTISELEERYKKLEEKAGKEKKELIKELEKTKKENKILKEKARNSIKHLVEDIIEPKEKELIEISKRITELESLLFEKTKDHKMIVKSAEKELAEMLHDFNKKEK